MKKFIDIRQIVYKKYTQITFKIYIIPVTVVVLIGSQRCASKYATLFTCLRSYDVKDRYAYILPRNKADLLLSHNSVITPLLDEWFTEWVQDSYLFLVDTLDLLENSYSC